MLIHFNVTGFLSIEKPVDLYFIPTANARIKGTRFESNFSFMPKYKIMKSTVFFGANASGKTNLLNALKKIKDIILQGVDLSNVNGEYEGYFNYNSDGTIAFSISLYDPYSSDEYEYNLKYNKKIVLEESFIKNEVVLFCFNDNVLSIANEAGVKEKDSAERLFSGESTETCLKKLTDYMVKDITAFKTLANDIKINLQDIVPIHNNILSYSNKHKTILEKHKHLVLGLLQTLDTSIDDFSFKSLPDKQYEFLIKRNNFEYHLGIESKGIQKIVHLLLYFIMALKEDKVLVIDELDSSISTKTLIDLFNEFINTDLNHGQFIITSHNPFLLNQNIFHKQQLYIVNKDDSLNTEVYSVDEFNLRSDKLKLYEEYLKGKFGGING